jgi:hypothetical protein
MKTYSPSALLIGDDPGFSQELKVSLKTKFQIDSYHFTQDDIRSILRMTKPMVLIWDCRNLDPRWPYLVSWLRDHFHGRPIIALIDENEKDLRMQMQERGVNLILNMQADDYEDNFSELVLAILSDYEKIINSTYGNNGNIH